MPRSLEASRVPALILCLLYLLFVGYLFFSAGHLPDRVATHFDGNGHPNGWMSRSGLLLFILILGFTFPLIVAAIVSFARFLPDSLINIPRREYWLAAERRADTLDWLFRHALWFACIGVSFVTSIHFLVVQANARPMAQLSTPWLLGLLGCFIVALTTWAFVMIRRFRRSA